MRALGGPVFPCHRSAMSAAASPMLAMLSNGSASRDGRITLLPFAHHVDPHSQW